MSESKEIRQRAMVWPPIAKAIRQLFHKINNQLNIISVTAGAAEDAIELEAIKTMQTEKLKEELEKAKDVLVKLVDSAVEAGNTITELKNKVYKELNIDTSKPAE